MTKRERCQGTPCRVNCQKHRDFALGVFCRLLLQMLDAAGSVAIASIETPTLASQFAENHSVECRLIAFRSQGFAPVFDMSEFRWFSKGHCYLLPDVTNQNGKFHADAYISSFVHAAFFFDDFTTASMKAMPRTPSWILGKSFAASFFASFWPDSRARMALAKFL